MKTYMHILTFLLSALLFYGCDSTEPDKDKHPNITWKVYNIGTNDSNIRDIFIIDENNIWAVGQIRDENTYTYDSLGNWRNPYNVAIWNGEIWNLQTILYKNISFGTYQSIWAFDRNDVWFGATSSYAHWNGNDYIFYDIPNAQGPESRVWGSSDNTLFLADDIGTIAYYDGTNWITKIKYEAKTIIDFWGVSGTNILFASYAEYFSSKNQVFKIDAYKTYDLNWYSGKTPHNIWTNDAEKLWVAASDGLYKYENRSWQAVNFPNSFNSVNVRGTSQEDIYVVGTEKLVAHYNGMSWQTYDVGLDENATFYTLSVRENVIAFAGHADSGFIVVIGYIQ